MYITISESQNYMIKMSRFVRPTIFSIIEDKEAANPHIGEAGSSKCLVIFQANIPKWLIIHQNLRRWLFCRLGFGSIQCYLNERLKRGVDEKWYIFATHKTGKEKIFNKNTSEALLFRDDDDFKKSLVTEAHDQD